MAGGKRHRTVFYGISSRMLVLVSAALLVLSYAATFVNPARAWFMTLFGLLFLPLWLLNLFLLLWALARRSRLALVPLFALLPTLFLIGRYYQFRAPERTEDAGLKLVSYNVGRFAFTSSRGISERACADSVTAWLRSCDADIICLQEVSVQGDVKAWFKRRLPEYNVEYYVFPTSDGSFGNVTLSRFPLLGKGRIGFDDSANLAIWGDYDIGGKALRVYNCHFQSYNISLQRVAERLSGAFRLTVRDTEEKMRSSISRRPAQVDKVLGDIGGCEIPSIVAGDFNDTPMSYTYHRLLGGRNDAFVEAGKGFGATYAFLRPLLRIDYILYPRAMRAGTFTTGRVRYSDHFPITAELCL